MLLLAFAQGVLVTLVLGLRARADAPTRILTVLASTFTLYLGACQLDALAWRSGSAQYLGWGHSLPFLFGPLLYLYVLAVTGRWLRCRPTVWLHLLPFAADALFMMIAFYTRDDAVKWALVLETSRGHGPASARLSAALLLVQGASYVTASARTVRAHAARLHALHVTGFTRARVGWLASLVVANGLVWGVALARHLLALLGRPVLALGAAVPVGTAIVVLWIGFVGLVFPRVLRETPRVPRPSGSLRRPRRRRAPEQ